MSLLNAVLMCNVLRFTLCVEILK